MEDENPELYAATEVEIASEMRPARSRASRSWFMIYCVAAGLGKSLTLLLLRVLLGFDDSVHVAFVNERGTSIDKGR